MYQNKIVVRYSDGRLQKGTTMDFVPHKDSFHFIMDGAEQDGKLPKVRIDELKAVFFVRDFTGNPYYRTRRNLNRGGRLPAARSKCFSKTVSRLWGPPAVISRTVPAFSSRPRTGNPTLSDALW